MTVFGIDVNAYSEPVICNTSLMPGEIVSGEALESPQQKCS